MTATRKMAGNLTRAQEIERYVWLSGYEAARDAYDGRMSVWIETTRETLATYDRLLEHFLASFPEPEVTPADPFDRTWARLDLGPDEGRFAEFVSWLEPLGTKSRGRGSSMTTLGLGIARPGSW